MDLEFAEKAGAHPAFSSRQGFRVGGGRKRFRVAEARSETLPLDCVPRGQPCCPPRKPIGEGFLKLKSKVPASA